MKKIKSVSEAFSTQPLYAYVGMTINGAKINSIELESINFPVNGEPYMYRFFVGRDDKGDIIFQLRAEATNVIYNP